MLSIGKLQQGQASYYEEQVARGRDDYYAGKGEAPGLWAGALAGELGLAGQVSAEAFSALLSEGRDPRTGEALRAASKVTAYDFTFSAPKSVSVLFGVADEETSAAIRDAHDAAVRSAFGWVEREAVFARRGRGGRETVRGRGLVAAMYRHRLSRAADVQLHSHVVAANLTLGSDGRWSALHAYPAHQMAKAAGCVYEAELRRELCERLAWVSWGVVRNGIAEIEGVPERVLREFSQRRARILEWVAEHGESDAGLRKENAVLATREAKREAIDMATLRARTRARAEEQGWGQEEVAALSSGRERGAGYRAVANDDEAIRAYAHGGREGLEALEHARAAGPGGLTRVRNTFERRHVVEYVASTKRQGATAGEVDAEADRMLTHAQVREVRDPDRPRFTTEDLLGHERAIVEGAERRAREGAGRVDPGIVRRVVDGWPVALNAEQRAAIWQLTSSGRGLEHVEALAGTGKTTMLGALAEVYRQAGYRVVGTAKTGRGVRELKERAGVAESWTGRSLLGAMERYGRGLGSGRTVLLFDEAGMSETREAARLIARAECDGVKVIAIGDSGQLTSVEAGGWLGGLTKRFGASELTQVMRQRDPDERRALAGVRDGHPDGYLRLQRTRGALRVRATPEQAERNAVAAWWQAQQQTSHGQAVMVARDNTRRGRLNAGARALLQAEGRLPAEGVELGGQQFVVGDRVIARRNDRLRDVDNGMRGTVVAVDPSAATVTIEADAGGRRVLDRAYVEEHLEHAYALTGHGTQGGTLERAVVVGRPEEFTRNWGYTALSRAREQTEVILIAERRVHEQRDELAPGERTDRTQEETLDAIGRALRQPDDEDLALAQLQAHESMEHDPEPPVAQPVAQEAAADRLDAAATAAPERVDEPHDPVPVPDPVDRYRQLLGPQRAGALTDRVAAYGERARQQPERELRQQRQAAEPALAALDRRAAYEARRIEQAREQTAERARVAVEHADALEARAEGLGWWRRRERDGLLAQARVQRQLAQRAADEHARLQGAERQLHHTGRHPDRWLAEHGDQAARGLAADRELAARREHELRAHADRAVEHTPAHIREAIGTRPHQPGQQRDRWDQLARDLERHRLEHQRADEPATTSLDRHHPATPDLARRVHQMRAERAQPPERAPAVQRDAPDAGREL